MTTMKNSEPKMQENLETVIHWKMYSTGSARMADIWALCHDLAEAQYPPALKFFVEGLNDPDWEWRQRFLQLIGFHYDIPANSEIIDKVRKMLKSDPDSNVRMTAADVLGAISFLPDSSLVSAINSDPDWFVRRSAYLAMLELAGVPYAIYVQENERFDSDSEQPAPTLNDIKRILVKEGIEVPPNTFD